MIIRFKRYVPDYAENECGPFEFATVRYTEVIGHVGDAETVVGALDHEGILCTVNGIRYTDIEFVDNEVCEGPGITLADISDEELAVHGITRERWEAAWKCRPFEKPSSDVS